MEPFELVDIDVPEEFSGSVVEMLGARKGAMLEMGSVTDSGMISMQYEMPSRAMAGVKSRLMSATRGLAVMTTTFAGYRPHAGDFDKRDRGNLLSTEQGAVTAYGLMKAQDRGSLFVSPADDIYEHQIIGMNSRAGDLKVNVCKTKHLTNVRSTSADDKIILTPAIIFSLEDAVEYIEGDEVVEVTPTHVRMSKPPAR